MYGHKINYMNADDLKLTFKGLSYDVFIMESESDTNIRSLIFQEYKVLLGTSFDDRVLALSND